MTCLVCGAEFAPQKNSKTCSSKCSAVRKTRRERAYREANPRVPISAVQRQREVVTRVRFVKNVNRAVRLLFALTGDHHADKT